MIPRFRPSLGPPEFFALLRRNRGAVARFEEQFARSFEAREAISFPYGRSALRAFLEAVGVRDAEVVMPAYTCSVVAHAITLSGNRPAFVDIRLDDYNMDLDLLPAAINENTRAVIATHLFGFPLDLDRLEAIVSDAEKRHGRKIWLVQDCAHSFGARWRGRMVCSSGDAALYGLNISKTITSIFGGMLTFREPGLAAPVRALRDERARKPGFLKPWKRRLYLAAAHAAFSETIYGLTWRIENKTALLDGLARAYHLDDKIHFPPDHLDRMLDVEAAVGLEQLEKYPAIIAARREAARWYNHNLPRRAGWVLPPMVDGATWSHYVVRVPDRRAVTLEFARRGIHLGELIQYSVPRLPGYREISWRCPNADLASRTTVNFPLDLRTRARVFPPGGKTLS